MNPSNPPTPPNAPKNNSLAAENEKLKESHAGTGNIENKKGFFGSYLVNPIKNAARYIADGIRTVFRSIRSFLISVCSPIGSYFRGEKNADPVRRDVSSRQVEPHEQSAFAEPASQDRDYPITLPGHVKLVSSHPGIGGFIRSRPFEKAYGVVNSIDTSGKLQRGVGCAIKELAGDGYARATREKQCSENPSDRLNYGQCTTCHIALEQWKEPEDSGGKNWRTIHNVLVPFSDNPKFETHLKNSLLAIFKESVRGETAHIVLPLLGCGRAGGTGEQLAQALFAAAREFQSSHPYHQPPEMVLVGTESSEDRQALAAFESKWMALNQQASATEPTPPSWAGQPDESTPSDISAGAVAEPGPSPSGVTPAASPSAGIPARTFPAGTDAMTWDNTGPAHQCGAALDEMAPDVRPPSARPLSQEVHETRTIPIHTSFLSSTRGRVTLVHADMKTFVTAQEMESKGGDGFSYEVVSLVDEAGQLQGTIKDVVDEGSLTQLQRGQQCVHKVEHGSSGLDNLQAVCGVRLRPLTDPGFDQWLAGSIADILNQAARDNINRVFLPLSLNDAALAESPSGGQMAQALDVALDKFRRYHSGQQPPEVFLVGTGDDSTDVRISEDFKDAWLACEKNREARRAQAKTRKKRKLANPSGASPRVVGGAAVTRTDQDDAQNDEHKVLIDGLLEAAMCTDGGMFGYGRELSSKGEKFDLVNAANENMCHLAGVARQFAKDLGARFEDDTKEQANGFPGGTVPAGQCITTESYDYATDSKFGLTGCRYIHSVVAPDKNRTPSAEYENRFKDAFVSVLLAAAERGSDTVVSCFIGCAIFGGDGHIMATALHAAYQDDRIKGLPKVPKLVLTGWNNPTTDNWKVYRSFVWTFESLNDRDPIKLPSQG